MACLGSAPSSLVLQTSAFTRLAYKPSARVPDITLAESFLSLVTFKIYGAALFVQNLVKASPEQKSSVIKN